MSNRPYFFLPIWDPKVDITGGLNRSAFLWIATAVVLAACCVTASLDGMPLDAELFTAVYLKDVLLVQIFIVVGWFVSGAKTRPRNLDLAPAALASCQRCKCHQPLHNSGCWPCCFAL